MGLNVSGVATLHLPNPVKNPSVVVSVKVLTGTRREWEGEYVKQKLKRLRLLLSELHDFCGDLKCTEYCKGCEREEICRLLDEIEGKK